MDTFKGHVLLPVNSRDEVIPTEDCIWLGTGWSRNRALTASPTAEQEGGANPVWARDETLILDETHQKHVPRSYRKVTRCSLIFNN